MNKEITIALIGNPNTGKTSLLNSLTGMSLHVGNWPGKTVEKKEGTFKFRGETIHIIDLPGTYSIKPYSEEEKVSDNYIKNGDADVIIQVVDINTLPRNLIMAYEILALNKKVILAFNFNEEAKKKGLAIDVAKIGHLLEVPVVCIEANRGKNNDALLEAVVSTVKGEFKQPQYLKSLCLGTSTEIDRVKAMAFFTDKIKPYYRDTSLQSRIRRADRIILNKYSSFPIFLLVMILMFKIIFAVSGPLIGIMNSFFENLATRIPTTLPSYIHSFIENGLLGGIGTVLSFAPLIFFLFSMIAILEDSGYLGRTVILVDRLFQKFGISGRSFIPMILGFGCNVPAILATRTIKNHKERTIAIMTSSFISCGARLPVYALFAGIFFPKHAVAVISGLYALGIVVNLIVSLILSRLIKNNEPKSLIIELPPYRFPVLKNILKHAWLHTREFMHRAATFIFVVVLIVWLFASLPLGVEYGSRESWIGQFGQSIAPVFSPLGFGYWTFAVALIFGLLAKEVVIGTLGTLYGVSTVGLASVLPSDISLLGVISFLVFVSLYTPCVAAMVTIRKESGRLSLAIAQPIIAVLIAWTAAFITYRIGLLFI
ncbi:MAG TPA: ferrous iron transport protein B [Patescibacteria group bacterium]|nr:ferrous iron transport protein B [Patescibacteria group bacterium]